MWLGHFDIWIDEGVVLYRNQYAEFDEVLHEGPTAIICVSYCNEIPTSEDDLITYNDQTAILQYFIQYGVTTLAQVEKLCELLAEHIKHTP